MSLGGAPHWVQCSSEAIAHITVVQEVEATFPACQVCVDECISSGMKVKSVNYMASAEHSVEPTVDGPRKSARTKSPKSKVSKPA